jgi:predicted amidohydrolase
MSTSAARRSKIAVAQLCSTASKLDSLLSVAKCAGWAKREGCSMLFLPENCGFLGESLEQTLEQAEPLLTEQTPGNDPFVIKALEETVDECAGETRGEQADSDLSKKTIVLLEGLQTVARKANMWMSAGIHVAGAPPLQAAMNGSENPRIYNTQVILDNEGNLQCYYRKIHLFDISIPGKVNLRESATTAPGTELVICDSPIGKGSFLLASEQASEADRSHIFCFHLLD